MGVPNDSANNRIRNKGEIFSYGKMRESEEEASLFLSKYFDFVMFVGDSYDFFCKRNGKGYVVEVKRSKPEIQKKQYDRIKEKCGNNFPILMYKKMGRWVLDYEFFNKEWVKKRERNPLLLLLPEISANGSSLSTITENLKWSKQRLNYHLNRLKLIGLVKKEQSYPFAIYSLTSFGEGVKKFLRQSEKYELLWRVHNGIVAFDIKDWGGFNLVESSRRRKVQMNNWFYLEEVRGEWKINFHSTGVIKIYVPERYTSFPDSETGTLISEATNIVQDICIRYSMKTGLLYKVREFEKELVGSEKLAHILGRFRTGEIFSNASNGILRVEEKANSHKIEDLLALPKQIEKLSESLENISIVAQGLKQHWDIHLPLMQRMDETQKQQQEALRFLVEVVQELKDVVKELKKA